jgi:site-specific recombinase
VAQGVQEAAAMQRNSVSRVPMSGVMYRRLDELCEFASDTAQPQERVFWFVQLVRWLRGNTEHKPGLRLRYLRTQLEQHVEWRDNVSQAINALLTTWDFEQLLAYGGIPRDFHFTGAVVEWLRFRVLPSACSTDDPVEVLMLAFDRKDTRWLPAPELGKLALMLVDLDTRANIRRAMERALISLSNQLVAQAHSPSVNNLSRVERSPFAGLNAAVETFVSQTRSERQPERLLGRLDQCAELVARREQELAARGADLNTTFQLERMQRQLGRLQLLVHCAVDSQPEQLGRATTEVVDAVTRNSSGRLLFERSSELWLRNLVDTTAAVGQDYLGVERSAWHAAFVAGAGGGVLMSLATISKYMLGRLGLPPIYEGIVYSFNYAMAFCAAYLLHFTIATKLPAHTAAALAKSVQENTGHLARLRKFLSVWRALVRLQVAGLLGNVMVVVPLSLLLDRAVWHTLDSHILDHHTAEHVLHANSLLGPSVLFAALTGVFLWLSSFAAAAVDNWARVVDLGERLSTNLKVMQNGIEKRARPRAAWLVERIGGLAGNATLGLLLGGVPAMFAVLQLPVEIRHVTVSAGSFALAISHGGWDQMLLWNAALGVLAIGMVNVSASFALALQVALSTNAGRARNSARALVKLAVRRWLKGAKIPRPAGLHPEPLAVDARGRT